MGFMDKAKQMAEQAQQKIDDAQKQFNESQGNKSAASAGGGAQRFDEHGRPITDAPPAAEAPPAPVEPAPDAPAEPAEPVTEEPVAPPPVQEGVDANPDPFKPLQ